MTGAGSASVFWTLENSFAAGPQTDPTWYLPGKNITVSELAVNQALQRTRDPDDPTPDGSREGPWEGAATVSWDITDANWHDLVFADGGTALPHSSMLAPTASWYFGIDLPDGSTIPRTPVGTAVVDAAIEYNRGEHNRVELTMLFGDEDDSISEPDEANIERPTNDQIYTYHGSDLVVDGTAQALMQSCTLQLSNLSRMRTGQSRKPYDAVTGAIEPSLSSNATLTENDQKTLSAASTSNGGVEIVGAVDAVFSMENGLGDTIEYALSGVQPTTYSWADLVAADTDLSEPIDYHVADVEATETTA